MEIYGGGSRVRALQRHLSRREFHRLDLTARFFRVLGDPTRLKVLELLLADGELSVSAMLQRLGIRQGRLSSHLACLRWCGYVTSEERGRFMYYRVTDRRVRGLVELAHRLAAENAAHLATCTRIDPPPRRRRSRGARV
jgi:DNA-binding transcriptional ArsR family regulator